MISLLAAAAALSPKLVSLCDLVLASTATLSPKLVSLSDFALGCRGRLISQACLPSYPRLVSLAENLVLEPKN